MLLIASFSNAQSLGYLDLPVAGELWIEFKDTVGSNISITASGAGQVWNYQSNFVVHDTIEILYQNPNTVPSSIANLFPQATLVEAADIPGEYTFYKTDFTGLYLNGWHSDAGIDVAGYLLNDINFTNNELIIPIPFQFGDVIQNTATYEYIFPDSTLYPGALVRVTYSTFQDMETESQGELTTPLGTYSSVIRIKEMRTETILYEIDSFAVGNYSYFTDLSLPTTSNYRWFKNGPNCLVMKAALDEFDNITSASYFTSSGLVALEPTVSATTLQLYPNPVKSGNNLSININNNLATSIVAYDISGREIHQTPLSHNSSNIIMSTENYEAGVYFIKVFDQQEILMVSKFVVTK